MRAGVPPSACEPYCACVRECVNARWAGGCLYSDLFQS